MCASEALIISIIKTHITPPVSAPEENTSQTFAREVPRTE